MIFFGAAAACHFINTPGVGRLRMTGERTAKRNHRTHPIGHHLGELPRIETAKAPTDQADLASMRVGKFAHEIDHRALHAIAQADGQWKPFDRSGWRSLVYPDPNR